MFVNPLVFEIWTVRGNILCGENSCKVQSIYRTVNNAEYSFLSHIILIYVYNTKLYFIEAFKNILILQRVFTLLCKSFFSYFISASSSHLYHFSYGLIAPNFDRSIPAIFKQPFHLSIKFKSSALLRSNVRYALTSRGRSCIFFHSAFAAPDRGHITIRQTHAAKGFFERRGSR